LARLCRTLLHQTMAVHIFAEACIKKHDFKKKL